MICPKCGAEMELGYIPGTRGWGLMWIPENRNPWVTMPSDEAAKKKNGIYFDTKPPVKKWLSIGKALPMYLCRSCKIGLVDCASYMLDHEGQPTDSR